MNVNFMCGLRSTFWSISRRKIDCVASSQVSYISARNSSDIPKNTIAHIYSASSQPENGRIYDYKPFRMRLYPKKDYHWCLCGYSKSQPLCDGTHKLPQYKCTLKPIKFQVEEEDDYYLCNCKQTKLRPFCDGTHKTLL
ncbi:CDGSH iron-sulfur domain-containing protein 3, mitochondrial [Thrips palmi]|uniref:CDGSH iron-sulfur domain-containing protein 3, mitochondrial n=1 Tax=Thrips palmi TaxID=161013 RepID=A0A6P8Y323_THRPL|nr:CDGSH iron-sulfur domain-containing protein 3, mitochondrial [Thrips palmi]